MRCRDSRLTGLLACALLSSFSWSVHAQNATAGLYVCTDEQGMNNILTKTQLPTAKGQCKPYSKGIFNADQRPPLVGNTLSLQTLEPNTGQSDIDSYATHSEAATNHPFGALDKTVPLTFADTGAQPITSLVQNPSSTSSLPVSKEALANDTASIDQSIYMCPKSNGTHEVIQAVSAPYPTCILFQAPANTTQNGQEARGSKNDNDDKVATSQTPIQTNTASAEVVTLSTPPQDIYKCFDQVGRASYVGENERHKFKRCTFFSRSFASAQQQLKLHATQSYTLAELAASGVNNDIRSNAALECTGAGQVAFNGQVKEYNCATRSFNYSPGSSGGSIELGDQRATIAAHRLDYFESTGSCGGTVLAENGRVLHLQPTKECPESFKIEAQRIAKVVEKSLSINVSGAFKERQRTLAPQINQIARDVGVDPFLIHAVISAESAYKYKAVSHAGAQGLMQLMPATAERFGVTDSFHTGQNIRGGSTYLKWLLKEFNGNLELAIAGYNAGEGNVRKYGYKIPPFIETRAYVPKVLEYYRRYRSNPTEVGL